MKLTKKIIISLILSLILLLGIAMKNSYAVQTITNIAGTHTFEEFITGKWYEFEYKKWYRNNPSMHCIQHGVDSPGGGQFGNTTWYSCEAHVVLGSSMGTCLNSSNQQKSFWLKRDNENVGYTADWNYITDENGIKQNAKLVYFLASEHIDNYTTGDPGDREEYSPFIGDKVVPLNQYRGHKVRYLTEAIWNTMGGWMEKLRI